MRYASELALAERAAREAGALLRAELHRSGGPRGSGTHADADVEAERIIRDVLLGATSWSYLGEETGRAQGSDAEHVWVVDPNDGTGFFVHGSRGSTVSIGALRGGVPILGVVFAFAYPDDEGDLIAWAEGQGPILRNGRAVQSSLGGKRLAAGETVLVSQAADSCSLENGRCVAPARYLALPSIAYRLALAAAGEGVAGVALKRPTAWDYAAGHALLRAAGGDLVDERGEPVGYAQDGASRTEHCFGGALEAIRDLAARPWHTVLRPMPRSWPRLGLVYPAPGRLSSDTGALRRAQGTWFGQLTGDSLGSLVEFESAPRIAARYPAGLRELRDGGTWDTFAGQPTDDSEMALMLGRTLAADGAFGEEAALDAYVTWYQSRPFDMGGTTRAALAPAAAAEPGARVAAARASANPDSQANGALMRASPLGIFAARRGPVGCAAARADAALTHPHPLCASASAVFVAAIAAAIGGADAEGAWRAAREEASRDEDPNVAEILEAARRGPPERFDVQQGWVRTALQNAFHRALTAASFEQGVVDTVMAGGDTDTNGAIAGALLGALHGREAVPPAWRRAVLACRPIAELGALQPRPMEFWPVDAMFLSERLLG